RILRLRGALSRKRQRETAAAVADGGRYLGAPRFDRICKRAQRITPGRIAPWGAALLEKEGRAAQRGECVAECPSGGDAQTRPAVAIDQHGAAASLDLDGVLRRRVQGELALGRGAGEQTDGDG